MSRFKRGVTLVELLIVIAVVSILAAAVIVAINPGKRMGQARDSGRKAALSTVSRALLAYYLDRQTYPAPNPSDTSVKYVESTAGDNWIPGLKPDYLKNLPTDPKQAALMTGLATVSNKTGQVAPASTDRSHQSWRGFYLHPNNVATYQSNSTSLTGTIIEQKWENIETSPGVFFSGQINQLKNGVTNAANAGAGVGVRIWAGHYIPSWLCDGATLPVGQRPQCVTIPDPAATVAVPWDANYQARYTILVNKVMQELGSLPQTVKDKIYWVNVGAGVQFNEMSIKAASDNAMYGVGYTQQNYKNAWVQATNTWVNARDQYLPGVPVLVHLDSSPQDSGEPSSHTLEVAMAVADTVCPSAATCPNIWFGTASMNKDKQQGFIDSFIGLLSRTKVGFQIREELITDSGGALLAGGLVEYEGAIRRGLEIRSTPTDTTTGPEFISIRSEEVDLPELKAITQKYQLCFVNKIPPSSDPDNPCAGSPAATPTPGPTPEPGITPAPTATPAPGPEGDFKYRYYSSGLQTFELWAILEDKEDKETYPNPLAGRTCKLDPPSGTSYNYCVAY